MTSLFLFIQNLGWSDPFAISATGCCGSLCSFEREDYADWAKETSITALPPHSIPPSLVFMAVLPGRPVQVDTKSPLGKVFSPVLSPSGAPDHVHSEFIRQTFPEHMLCTCFPSTGVVLSTRSLIVHDTCPSSWDDRYTIERRTSPSLLAFRPGHFLKSTGHLLYRPPFK